MKLLSSSLRVFTFVVHPTLAVQKSQAKKRRCQEIHGVPWTCPGLLSVRSLESCTLCAGLSFPTCQMMDWT